MLKTSRQLPPSFSALLLPLCFLAGKAKAMELVPEEPVHIRSIKYNGTGCPAGTLESRISEGKDAINFSFTELIAEFGPNISPSNTRKSCIITLGLDAPAGWQFAVGSFQVRGYMALDPFIKATFTTNFFFTGEARIGTLSTTKEGPYAADFVYTDKVELTTVNIPDVWSRCGAARDLNLSTSIRLVNTKQKQHPNARGLLTIDTFELPQSYGLIWRKCH